MQSLGCNIFLSSFLIWFSLSSLYIPHFNRQIAIAAELLSCQTNIGKENNKVSPNYCFLLLPPFWQSANSNRQLACPASPLDRFGTWLNARPLLETAFTGLDFTRLLVCSEKFCLVLPSYLAFEIKTGRQSARLSNRLSLGNSQLMFCGGRLPVWNTKLLGIYSAFVAEKFE